MLALIRIVVLFIAFITINFLLLLICVVRPFHRDNVHIAGQMYSFMSRIIGLKLVMRVSEDIQSDTPYVFIANHQNSYDIFTICKAALPGLVTVGKKSLIWIPIFGQIYWLSGNIMIDRKNSGRARNTLEYTANKMRTRKMSIWFFPEGTRSYGRGLLPFKAGAFKLAHQTQSSIVRVTCSNTHEKVKLNRWNNGTVIIDVSAPEAMTDEYSIKEWMTVHHERMAETFVKLDAEVAEIEK